MHFISTIDLLKALKAKCETIAFDDGTKVFKRAEDVRFYHTPDLLRALVDMHGFAERSCFLVPGGDGFENSFSGRDLRSEATREIVMLLTDQHVDATIASTGNDKTPGVVKIKDHLIEKLLGEQLDFSPRLVRLRPASSEPVIISIDEQKKQPGRQAWQITWHADAGHTSVTPTS